ncbi:flagellar hook-length control protein FliK [Cupriavidus sp. TA19]|uniref:flagellar hook-length control protein FliK n=1 Tax=unclassified Cupriavidus TaxID=2640874 RepID=UPI0027294339|nr:flagellar hook-length control protein FliK [Cupriavidus sp. TA19]GLC94525.1 flagellar hook-length control protein FliK [Cupriavidus sp. TA19]
MTGLLLPPDATPTPRPDTQTLRPTLSVNKLAALLPSPDVTQTNARNPGEAGNAAIQARQAQDVGAAAHIGNRPAALTSTRETLSFAARAILDLLGRTEGGAARASATLMPAPPGPAMASALPAALAGLVEHSGLFYESHLAAWTNGARTLAQVRQDPQATLGQPAQDGAQNAGPVRPVALLPAPAAGTVATASHATGYVAADASISPADLLAQALAQRAGSHNLQGDLPQGQPSAPRDGATLANPTPADPAPSASRSPMPAPHTGTGPAATPQQGAQRYEAMARAADAPTPAARVLQSASDSQGSQPVSAAPAGPAVHPGAEGLVRQQLELLASQQFRWVGEAWPGTHMAWEIAREPVEPDDQGRGGTQGQTWSTRVLLELPELGTIEARLSLSPGGLAARLVAGESNVASRFDDARGKLQERLTASGIALLEFTARTGTPRRPGGAP